MNRSAASALVLALVTLLVSAEARAEEPRHLRKKIPLEGLETVRFEVPTAHLQVVPAPGDDVRVDLSLECLGELIACGNAVREMRITVDRHARTATLRIEGPEGFEKQLRSDQRRQRPNGGGPGDRDLEGNYDATGRSRGWIGDWGWRKPKPGDFALATVMTVRFPMKANLVVTADDADVEIHDLQVSAHVTMNRGSFFAGIAMGNAGSITLEVKKGETQIFDRTNRLIGTKPDRHRLEWTGPGDKAQVEAYVKLGSAQVRLQ